MNRTTSGWLLLASSLLIGCITIYWRAFGDEFDNLVVATLMTRGSVLYRDIFSHHFPFPYYWTAAVIAGCGKSILAVRLSVWLFQLICFATAMRLSRYYLAIGITAFAWSVIKPFYYGHMVLYNSFCAPSMLVIATITMAAIQNKISFSRAHICAVALFSCISLLSDPLSVYALIIAFIFLLKVNIRSTINAGMIIILGLACYVAILLISGTWIDFYNNAIVFNAKIYNKYMFASPARFGKMLTIILNGLGINDSVWFNIKFDPLNGMEGQFDKWLFSGFLYRITIIAGAIVFALKKDYRAAFFIYFFAAALIVISKWDFRSQPFIIFAIMTIGAIISGDWWHSEKAGAASSALLSLRLIITASLAWMLLQSTLLIYEYRHQLSYQSNFGEMEKIGAQFEELLCKQKNVKLALYPGFFMHQYWFLDRSPVSKYIFMWPWVAEIGLPEVISELGQKGSLSLIHIDNSIVWEKYMPEDYLRPLLNFLDKNYVKISDGLYISSELEAKCEEVRK